MKILSEYLVEAEKNHGHMCPGQILGVRMAMLGCKLIGIDEPKQSKKLIVFVEIDRCAADAVNTVTGCRLGKRTLKFQDYGKLAATFLNTETNEAVRIIAVESSRNLEKEKYAHLATKKEQQMEAYKNLPDKDLFKIQKVTVNLPETDRPGHPLTRVLCEVCGEGINDKREVNVNGKIMCKACAGVPYYKTIS